MANRENQTNGNYDPEKYYKEYMASMYSAENIQKAGGVANFNKAIKKFERGERKLRMKRHIWMFFHCYLSMIAIPVVIIFLIKILFF